MINCWISRTVFEEYKQSDIERYNPLAVDEVGEGCEAAALPNSPPRMHQDASPEKKSPA